MDIAKSETGWPSRQAKRAVKPQCGMISARIAPLPAAMKKNGFEDDNNGWRGDGGERKVGQAPSRLAEHPIRTQHRDACR